MQGQQRVPLEQTPEEVSKDSKLRLKLHEKGLNVDGSREAMIAALKSLSPQG
jgi:hypothetical protein